MDFFLTSQHNDAEFQKIKSEFGILMRNVSIVLTSDKVRRAVVRGIFMLKNVVRLLLIGMA